MHRYNNMGMLRRRFDEKYTKSSKRNVETKMVVKSWLANKTRTLLFAVFFFPFFVL